MGVVDGLEQEDEDEDVACVGAMDRVTKQCSIFGKFFPILTWGSQYSCEDAKCDINAGLTVGCMLVPQCMAYALLADLPVNYGLYSSVIPLYVYAFLGTSGQCGIGPVAVISLMISSSFTDDMDQDAKIEQAMYLSFIMGLLMVIMGCVRLGVIVNFISHSVMSAFTSGAGITIGTSQCKHLFGVTTTKFKLAYVFRTLAEIVTKFSEWSWETMAMGFSLWGLMLALKQWKGCYPKAKAGQPPNSWPHTIFTLVCDFSALVCAVIGTFWAFGFRESGIAIKTAGEIPSGLQTPTIDAVPSFDKFEELVVTALLIAIVGYLESIAVCQIMALRTNTKIDANQELFAIGGANLIGSFFSGFPVVGSFSRTAVNGNTGSRTPMCGIITATVVLGALYFLTSLFYFLPLCALAAMVEVAVLNLVDFHEIYSAYQLDKRDFAVMMITFLTTLCWDVKMGLFIGVGASILLVVQHSAFPRVVVLGKRDNGQYRDKKRLTGCKDVPGVLIIRLDAKLFFANAAKFHSFVIDAVDKRDKVDEAGTGTLTDTVIIDARGINDVDLSGLHMLHELVNELKRDERNLVFCNINDKVKKRMHASAVYGAKAHARNENDDYDSSLAEKAFLLIDDTQDCINFIQSQAFANLIAPDAENDGFADPVAGYGEARIRSASENKAPSSADIEMGAVGAVNATSVTEENPVSPQSDVEIEVQSPHGTKETLKSSTEGENTTEAEAGGEAAAAPSEE